MMFRKTWLIICAFMFISMGVLVTSCTLGDNIHDAQAEIYEEYKLRLDTALSCESLKDINESLDKKLVEFIKSNNEEVLQAAKSGKNVKNSYQHLAKVETEYVTAYLNKIVSIILGRQNSIYNEHLNKLNTAETYGDILQINRSLSGATADFSSKYSNELKNARAKNLLTEKFDSLDKVVTKYTNLCISKVTPLLYSEEKAIYMKYNAKIDEANDLERLKQIKLFCDKEISALLNDNMVAYQRILSQEYLAEKEAATSEKSAFEHKYMKKVSPKLIEFQKQLYNGAAKMISEVKNTEELNNASNSFVEVNNWFKNENSKEIEWIENAVKTGNAFYINQMKEVDDCFRKVLEISNAKAVELGIK